MNTEPLRVGLIGAGKAGTSLGRYLVARIAEQNQPDISEPVESPRISLTGYFSNNPDSAKFAAELTGSAAFPSGVDLAKASDVVFFSVPDGKIRAAFDELTDRSREAGVDLSGKMFAHLSGSLSSEVFIHTHPLPSDELEDVHSAKTHGSPYHAAARVATDLFARRAFSLHPACALPDREESWRLLRETCFVFEGSVEARAHIAPLLELLGNPIGTVAPGRKALYHAACVFLSNFSVALAAEGTNLLVRCGLDQEISSKFLQTLFLSNAENVAKRGPTAALTGPAERGDADTIRDHIETLSELEDESLTAVYRGLTKILLQVASEKHPDRDYTDALAAVDY